MNCRFEGDLPIILNRQNAFKLMSLYSDDHMLLDMATSAAAVGKMELARTHGTQLPPGWALNKDGQPTTVPEEALPSGGGCGLPLGGSEDTSGYKGYGLALLVEIFCGILSGSAWGPQVRKWKVQDEIANLGQCFVAINPAAFTDDFNERMQVKHRMKDMLKNKIFNVFNSL